MQGITFSVVLTEGRPDETGRSMANALDKLRIPTVVILDCAAAWAIEALKCAPPPAGSLIVGLGLSV